MRIRRQLNYATLCSTHLQIADLLDIVDVKLIEELERLQNIPPLPPLRELYDPPIASVLLLDELDTGLVLSLLGHLFRDDEGIRHSGEGARGLVNALVLQNGRSVSPGDRAAARRGGVDEGQELVLGDGSIPVLVECVHEAP